MGHTRFGESIHRLDAAGLKSHFSLHDCRHTAASRLIWIAENEDPPDALPETESERMRQETAVFTDKRKWQRPNLAFVERFQSRIAGNHSRQVRTLPRLSPPYSFGTQHSSIARRYNRVDLDCARNRLRDGDDVDDSGFLIEKVFRTGYQRYEGTFEVVTVGVPEKIEPLFCSSEHGRRACQPGPS